MATPVEAQGRCASRRPRGAARMRSSYPRPSAAPADCPGWPRPPRSHLPPARPPRRRWRTPRGRSGSRARTPRAAPRATPAPASRRRRRAGDVGKANRPGVLERPRRRALDEAEPRPPVGPSDTPFGRASPWTGLTHRSPRRDSGGLGPAGSRRAAHVSGGLGGLGSAPPARESSGGALQLGAARARAAP